VTPRREKPGQGWTCGGSTPHPAGNDLFGHVNGTWLRTHEMPDDRAQDGAFRDLRDRAEEDVRAIIEEAPVTGRIGALYASFMDVGRIESAGVEPLRPLLARSPTPSTGPASPRCSAGASGRASPRCSAPR